MNIARRNLADRGIQAGYPTQPRAGGAHGSTPSEVALTIILEAMRRDMAKVRSTTLNSAPPQIIWAKPP